MENIKTHEEWESVPLAKICLEREGLKRGPFGSTIKKEFFVPNGYKVYEQSNAIYDDALRGRYFLDEKKYKELESFNVQPGDFIVSCSGTLGKIAEIPENAAQGVINQALLRIRLKKEIVDKKYFLYYFRSEQFQRKIFEQSQGTAMSNLIGMKDFKLVEIPLPSPLVQQAIVAKIEAVFSEIDKGIETLHTAQQQLKVYRQAVLKWAFVNDAFEEYTAKDITEKIQIGPFGTQLHKEDYVENGIPLINPTHIKDGLIMANKSFSILESKKESLPNYILKVGDVIMGRRGEMGRCGLVTEKENGWFCGTGSLYFRPKLKLVNPTFLYYTLRSEPVKKYLEENAGGTTMANLNLKIVNSVPVFLPSVIEQKSIVAIIEQQFSVADKMEEEIAQNLQQAETLKQSILKIAFIGNL